MPLDEIRALVDERGRYEGWLQALDARRAVTPAHVLDRVRQDYVGRMERVVSQLASHAAPLHAHEETLARRHHTVEQQLGEQRDTLAEVELRTLVGEYPADEGEQRRGAAQQTIATLERELGGAAAELADVRGLVARVSPPAPAAEPTPEAAPPDAPAVDHAAAAEPIGSEADPADVSPGDAPAEPPQTGTREGIASGVESGSSFDHGAVDAARVALGDRERSLTPAFNDAIRTGTAGAFGFGGPRPPAAEGAASGQEKTLRCQDCGALNYPTEWYCEKCGGELAAL
ncbi:hypothetical protein tb265_27950 [Gemmatimonadetes bacterium T265]|nr:hypothetical protein tb265_27950 [Gemmatimonadetes bacterium T265]